MDHAILDRVGADPRRYTLTAQALHWVSAVLMFIVLPLAWVMVNMPRTAPDREWLFTLHKSVGLTILAVVMVRTAWRAAHPPPPPSTRSGRIEHFLAGAAHLLLYVVMIGMPISGYVYSIAGGNKVTYFDLFTLPAFSRSDGARQVALWAHVFIGQWLAYALILAHLGAVAFHVAIRRDGQLDRMMPPQSPPPFEGSPDWRR